MRLVDKILTEQVANFILIALGSLGFVSFLLREYFGVPYGNYVLVSLVLILSYICSKSLSIEDRLKSKEKIGIFKYAFAAFLIAILIRSLFIPVKGWDAYSLYDLRGKMFLEGYSQRDLAELTKYDETNPLYYFSYPPMTSSLHAVIYSFGLESPMIVYALFFVTFSIYVFVFNVQQKVSKFLRMSFIACSLGFPLILQQITIAYTNLPMMTFQWGAFYHLFKYKSTKSFGSLGVSAVFLGFSVWTRVLEPTFFAFFVLAAIFVFFEPGNFIFKVYKWLLYVIITFVPKFVWSWYIASSIGTIGKTAPSLTEILKVVWYTLSWARIIEIAFFIFGSLMEIRFYILLFFAIFAFMMQEKVGKLAKNNSAYVAILIGCMGFVMFGGTLYLSGVFDWWKDIPGSFLRSNLIFIPLVCAMASTFLEERGRRKN